MRKSFDLNDYYLAGLLEGDGTIYVPKTSRCLKTNRILYPSIEIIFHTKDLALAEGIKSFLNFGYVMKQKDKNAYKYHVNNKEAIYKMIDRLNGKFKTPKINSLHRLIKFVNARDNKNIPLLPLNSLDLKETSWLTGFSEADGCFYVKINEKESSVSCIFELYQRMIDISGESCGEFMEQIANFFNVNVHVTKRMQYAIKASSVKSREILIEYFTKYPLKGSKYLDYLNWFQVIEIRQDQKLNGGKLDLDKIRLIKAQMNSNRSF